MRTLPRQSGQAPSHRSPFIQALFGRSPGRGAALATLLMVVAIAVILAFTLAGASVFHLNVAVHSDNASTARALAESAIAQGIERIIEKDDYGERNADGNLKDENERKKENYLVEIHLGGDGSDQVGLLTFEKGVKYVAGGEDIRIPYSTNNINQDVAVKGSEDRAVPKNCAHLLGTGMSNGVKRTIEAIIYIPPFPYSIASDGKFVSNGDLLVASVDDSEDIEEDIDDGGLLPGNMVSNSSKKDSVTLMREGMITGDLQTAGEVEFGPRSSVEILGELRTHSDPVEIPYIEIASYDPGDGEDVYKYGNSLEDPTLRGYCKATPTGENKMVTVAGDLILNSALFYVDGNLHVDGSVKGKGALAVTGTTTITQGADITKDNLVALLSGDDVTIGSPGSSLRSAFQGIVFTQGSFTAQNVTLLGAFINNNLESSPVITLDNVRIVKVPGYTNLEFNLKGLKKHVTFHYANKRKYPKFKLTPPQDGKKFEIENLTRNENDHFGKSRHCDNLGEVVDYFDEWWTYCEGNGLYRAGSDRDDRWDIDSGGSKDWYSPKDKIKRFLKKQLKQIGFTEEGGFDPDRKLKINLSEFINLDDQIQIILWKEM